MRGKCTITFEMTLLKIDKRGKTLVFRSKQQNKGTLIKDTKSDSVTSLRYANPRIFLTLL